MKLSTAMATVAGAGPKSSADVMKNVSATEMLASIDATLIVNEPVAIARRRTAATRAGAVPPAAIASECADDHATLARPTTRT